MGDAFEKDSGGELTHGEEVKDLRLTNPEMIDVIDLEVTSSLSDIVQTQCLDEKQAADPKAVQVQADVGTSCQEKAIKKPDKILPCPRCHSMDTKFCYYNNYNINQPRHFCKSCQRYWTAGGTMRNVPVGAGKRKSKHSSLHHRQLMISSCMTTSQGDDHDSSHKQVLASGASSVVPLKLDGTGLAGKVSNNETLSCESMGKMTSHKELRGKGETSSKDMAENGEHPKANPTNGSSCMDDNPCDKASQGVCDASLPSWNGFAPMHPLHCYPSPPWAYPWNPGWNNFAAISSAGRCGFELVHGQDNHNINPFPWNPPQMVPAPAFCAPTIPMQFIPASFWGCMPNLPNGAWPIPWVGSPGGLTTSTGNSGCSENNSPLGKHSRDSAAAVEEKKEKSIWIPKTLRIDDPEEAAKSSIWATLGIKPGKCEPSANGGIFKGFQPQNGENAQQLDATQLLHANPAAFCRSQTFQESS